MIVEHGASCTSSPATGLFVGLRVPPKLGWDYLSVYLCPSAASQMCRVQPRASHKTNLQAQLNITRGFSVHWRLNETVDITKAPRSARCTRGNDRVMLSSYFKETLLLFHTESTDGELTWVYPTDLPVRLFFVWLIFNVFLD